jgi:hypothetical protein
MNRRRDGFSPGILAPVTVNIVRLYQAALMCAGAPTTERISVLIRLLSKNLSPKHARIGTKRRWFYIKAARNR